MGLSFGRAQTAATSRGLRPEIIKVAGRQLILQLAILAFASAVAARAESSDKNTVSKQEVQAKLTYCENCHGVSAQGFHGFYPIPRLAGQQPEYLKNQVQAFVERRRTNNIMFHVSHVLSPAMLTALAENFHDLNPKPLTSAASDDLLTTGKKVYNEGLPDRDVPPCASCHGPEAKGDGQFPRLAGQLPDYIFIKLKNWDKERGQDPAKPDASTIMQPITHNLTDQQIKAVAAYLNHQE
jgi:cytochrome c553